MNPFVIVSVVLLLVVTYQPPTQPRAKGDSMDYLMRDGEVVELTGQGSEQRVRIRFDRGDERTFNASAAPIVKIEGK